jgi:cyclophilin family peptidyl-prolyl cis-trans isomerase
MRGTPPARLRALVLLLCGLALVPLAPPARSQDDSHHVPLANRQLSSREEFVASITVVREDETLGTMEVRLHDKYAPRHVRNFVRLAEKGFYDGTTFHRVQKDNFIQGGDPLSRDNNPKNDGTGGPGYTLPKENNAKKHTRGAVAMAAVGDKSSGSQFFIDLVDKPSWDGEYTVFGYVIKGMDVADAIGAAETRDDNPVVPHVMSVQVEIRKRKLKF